LKNAQPEFVPVHTTRLAACVVLKSPSSAART
jgi:hypothetical protein